MQIDHTENMVLVFSNNQQNAPSNSFNETFNVKKPKPNPQ